MEFARDRHGSRSLIDELLAKPRSVDTISDVHYRKVVFALTVIGAVVMLVRR